MHTPRFRVVVLTFELGNWWNGKAIVEANSIHSLNQQFPHMYDTWQQDLYTIMCGDEVTKIEAIEFQEWSPEKSNYKKISDPRTKLLGDFETHPSLLPVIAEALMS